MNEIERRKIKEAEMLALAAVHKDTIQALRQGVVSELTLCAERGAPMVLALNEIIAIAMVGLAASLPADITAEAAAEQHFAVMRAGLIRIINDMRAEKAAGDA